MKHTRNPRRYASLKDWREAHNLSQREAARVFGISQSAWARYELQRQRPAKEIAKSLKRRTGVSVEVLMGMAS